VNSYGVHSVGVYDGARADRSAVCRMLKENRIRYFSAADYRAGSELETLVFRILDKIAADEVLYRFTAENKKLLEKS
ncbi:MAG: haloacid dehalogenase-like hydrolase, partial [Clostridia bacterium]|nr:haloacid dehalogenase-like hydrolase [Clostridia bacterium]